MARTQMTAYTAPYAGISAPLGAVDSGNGNYFNGNDGNCRLIVNNASASPINVTIKSNGAQVGGLTVADTVIAVPNGATYAILIPMPGYTIQSDGTTWINFSATTSVTAVIVH